MTSIIRPFTESALYASELIIKLTNRTKTVKNITNKYVTSFEKSTNFLSLIALTNFDATIAIRLKPKRAVNEKIETRITVFAIKSGLAPSVELRAFVM